MSESEKEDWNFYFGRGGNWNQRRQVSKANALVQDLALQYSHCRQTEKRIFVKTELYDTVIRNGGSFYLVVNKEAVDVTDDADETINRIMQLLRDINKIHKTPSTQKSSQNVPKRLSGRRCVGSSLKTRKLSSTKRSSPTKTVSRPKRRCIRPSVIEPPIIECVRGALRVAKNDKAVPRVSTASVNNLGEGITPDGAGESEENSFDATGVLHLATNDLFDPLAVEAPKLENSFSALIMADEITADLPMDSQQSINQNLHTRVQRLENLVAMLMQQKNDEMERLLE